MVTLDHNPHTPRTRHFLANQGAGASINHRLMRVRLIKIKIISLRQHVTLKNLILEALTMSRGGTSHRNAYEGVTQCH
jgi:hypothetical protein